MKLKLNTSNSAAGSPSSTPAATPSAATPSGGTFKIKLGKASAPPTPATELPPAAPLGPPPTKPKRKYTKKPKPEANDTIHVSHKRGAEVDISPASKRRISFKLSGGGGRAASDDEDDLPTPVTAGGTKIKLAGRKQSIAAGPKNITIVAKKRPPQRPVGVGYDSEASDAETDPAIESQFVLRMAPGEDSEYLRAAIENRTVGLSVAEGGADVHFKFLDRDLRRAMVTVRGRAYAAVMVDLPCIVEGMKSWDKRGWWKVVDICQMLLVLGRCRDEAEAKNFALPKEVDRNSLAYAHGLTPPMHWVRKRRFKKRVSYREIENVEEEVEKLLKDDAAAVRSGGDVDWRILDTNAMHDAEMMQQDDYNDEDGYMESTEDQYGQAQQGDYEDEDAEGEEVDLNDTDLEAQLMAELDANNIEGAEAVAADAGATLEISSAQTPSSAVSVTGEPAPAAVAAVQSESSDEDEDDEEEEEEDMDSPDAIDEDALAAQNEEAQKREEIEDLEREVRNKRLELERTTNQLLKQRTRQNLRALEDELAMKRKAFDMEVDE